MNVQPWQVEMLKKMSGMKKGELSIMTAGRNIGKSHFTAAALKRLMDDINSRPMENLIPSEGKVYGSRYYCIEPVGGNWREMEDWCIKNYGSSTGSIWAEQVDKSVPQPGERWYGNNRKFWFRSEADRTMFIMKWR
jgi:hypothetical protein